MSTRHSFLSTTGLVRKASESPSTTRSTHASPGGTKSGQTSRLHKLARLPKKGGVFPLGPTFLVGIAAALSLMFIVSISMAFVGSDDDEPPFKDFLDTVASTNPGIVLIGDSVDIDVDEPALTIRWTIVACGEGFVLPGSEGTHGTASCGMPSTPFNIYVDSDPAAAATYDPRQFPYANGTNKRLGVQNLLQFDSDHVLDVHEARLYPFDTYRLASTLRATLSDGTPVPISRLTTVTMTSSFVVTPTDVSSYMVVPNNSTAASRDIDLRIERPGSARMYVLLLFAISWMLAHASIGLVVLAWVPEETDRLLRYLGVAFGALLVIPQLRNAMPDAPGYDGVLLDNIGFFPQMLASGVSMTCLLLMIARRELGSVGDAAALEDTSGEAWTPPAKGLHRLRRVGTSGDFSNLRGFSRTFSKSENPVREYGPGGGWAAFRGGMHEEA